MLSWEFNDVVENQTVTNIEHGVTAVQTRQRLVGEIAVSAGPASGGSGAAVPGDPPSIEWLQV